MSPSSWSPCQLSQAATSPSPRSPAQRRHHPRQTPRRRRSVRFAETSLSDSISGPSLARAARRSSDEMQPSRRCVVNDPAVRTMFNVRVSTDPQLRLRQPVCGGPGDQTVLSEMSSSEVFRGRNEERVDPHRRCKGAQEKNENRVKIILFPLL